MVDQAAMERTEHGLVPSGPGWFVVNAGDTVWSTDETFGDGCLFEPPDAHFEQIGYDLRILRPGQSNGLYHRENDQEDFLVLSGECLVLIEGEERRLRTWDFVHCPAGTEHIFVGAGDGPCLIFMVGGRGNRGIVYPRSELALRHGAGVEAETASPDEAYRAFPPPRPGSAPRLPLA